MLSEALKYFISGAKWAKVRVLLRELFAAALYSLKRLGSARSNKKKQLLSNGTDETPVSSDSYNWTYRSSLRLPLEVQEGVATRYKQEQLNADGLVGTEFSYHSAIYHDASVYSNGATHVTLFDCNDRRVAQFSSSKYSRFTPDTRRIEITRYLSGKTLSLYGNVENAAGNIAHWMIDGISRLFLAGKHHALEDIDHILVPRLKYGFQKESLLAIGVSENQIVEIDALECVRCERLIVTSAPRGYSSSVTPGWMIDAYRSTLLPVKAPISIGKRIYISRRDAASRKFVNEEELISCLEEFGFVAVEMSSFDFNQKIALFAQADIVVGLTGAGLSNLLFCRDKATVLELFPAGFVHYFYASMCAYLDLDYHYLVVGNSSSLNKVNRYYGNLSLDVNIFRAKLEELLWTRDELI